MKYAFSGHLAINPKALGEDYEPATPSMSSTLIEVRGPLVHHLHPAFDSYESIVARVAQACEGTSSTVNLVIDSPGGFVTGLFDACTQIRALADSSGKKLRAYVEGQALSAAYALACACDSISVGPTSLVGSIGVLDVRVDASKLNEAQGLRIAYITSGTAKAYGAPALALCDEELADRQRITDDLAGVFFAYVRDRRGVDPQPLQARVYAGESAVQAGLADQRTTYVAFLSNGDESMTLVEIVAALEDLAKEEGSDGELAKKALKVLQAPEEEPAPEEDEPAPEEEPKAESEEEDTHEASSTMTALAAQVQALSAQVASLSEAKASAEKATYLASRPDLSKELLAVLKDKPLNEIKPIVDALPKRHSAKAATVTVAATQGSTAGKVVTAHDDVIDTAMGLRALSSTGVEHSEFKTVLGAPKASSKKVG